MPNFTVDEIREAMYKPNNIRNMSVIAHVDHGKSTLTDTLIARAGIISQAAAGLARATDTREDEKERGITIKSTGVSLFYNYPYDAPNPEKKADGTVETGYLINLIDSPGHVDFSSEVTAALRVTDGALVVVDYVEGVCVQTETVLRQALGEKIKPVLFINKIDRGILELQVEGENMYQQFCRVIENANVIISTYEADDMGESQQVDPARGTVAWGSALFGWAFTLTRFARIYCSKFKIDMNLMLVKLWGDNYFDAKAKKWKVDSDAEDGTQMKRCFVQFIMEPVIRLCKNCMDGNNEAIDKMLATLEIVLTNEEKERKGKDKMRVVFQKWINAADALIEMII